MSDSQAEAGGSGAAIPPDEDSLTMLDVLQEEQELEDDAAAVLGNTDDKQCSYDQGYVKRQPLYVCLTCADSRDRPAGVCLACSYHCHEGHELIELYTKRNFRCDCGGGRQPGVTCRLTAKTGDNAGNSYNQNYGGLYCTCSRPYPDPEDDTLDQMVQCVVCEDWYHGRHLGVTPPEDGDYAEMTCGGCAERLPFLRQYASDADMAANVMGKSPKKSPGSSPKKSPKSSPKNSPKSSPKNSPKKEAACRLPSGVPSSPSKVKGALFWKQSWRTLLCTCDDCKAVYRSCSVEFLLDEEDSVAAYEARGRRGAGSYAAGMQALENMDRVQQLEVVHEYNDLKSELMSYLKKFAENKKVVREEDIQEFFSGMKSRKRQKTEMPHFCR